MMSKDYKDLGYCKIHPGKMFEGYCKNCHM